MKSIRIWLLAAVAAFGVSGVSAQAVVAGVKYAETADLHGGRLQLNGAGVRYKAIFTVITIKGVPQGEPFKGPEFYSALLRLWLGPNPADWKLKDALLGQPA